MTLNSVGLCNKRVPVFHFVLQPLEILGVYVLRVSKDDRDDRDARDSALLRRVKEQPVFFCSCFFSSGFDTRMVSMCNIIRSASYCISNENRVRHDTDERKV